MKLYYSILSPYSQKVMIAFYEKGVDFTPTKVNFGDEAGRAEYAKIYPLGKIPLLVDESKDLFIPESTIIIEFLENEYAAQGTSLIPSDKTAARRVRFKDRMHDLYVSEPVVTLYFDTMKPADQKNPEAVAKARKTLDVMYNYMEQSFAENQFASGNEFTMADCAAFPGLFYAQKLHPFSQYPNITAYFQRLMQRPSVQKVLSELLPVLQAM
ncbi:MAG: glutathione S-transferase family protein [Gammaproteobacteria bacterium]|nr:glutathione S-transferase family protein [Gammaproteobacteria bacterium]